MCRSGAIEHSREQKDALELATHSTPRGVLVFAGARLRRNAHGDSSNSKIAVIRYTSLYASNHARDFRTFVYSADDDTGIRICAAWRR